MKALSVALLACVTLLAAVLATPRWAWAATPEVRAELDADIVALGDSVQLSMQAMAENQDVDAADPGSPPSVRVEQASMGPMHSISIVNGVRSDRRGLRATWVLSPTTVGTFRISPTVSIGGKRMRARVIELRVVKPGQAPRSRKPPKGSPFDPFGSPFGDAFKGLIDLDDPLGRAPQALANPDLAMVPAPRGRLAFLHARVDKTSAVVGEQLTYSVYLFIDAEQAEPRYEDVHEAGTSDFLRQSILPEDSAPQMLGHANIGGRLWAVKLLRRAAIFPLRAGHLSITPMQLRISSGRMQSSPRESERLAVDVTEPPAAKKPPGVALGDVGKFKLIASVTPREIDAGAAITIEVELQGTGNLPTALNMPARKGIEYLPPDVKSSIAPDPQGRIGGRRTFTYVVRAHEAGTVDLGEITLPFFDPEAGQYDVARAALGTLVVKAGAARANEPTAPTLLEGLPKPRAAKEPPGSAVASFVATPVFWFAWLGPLLAAIAFIGASEARRRVVARRGEAREEDPRAALRGIARSVDEAFKAGDAKAADASLVRFVEASIQQRVGVAARAFELGRLVSELEKVGVDRGVGDELVRILREAETARFAPGGVTVEDAKARWAAARSVIDRLPNAEARSVRGKRALRVGAATILIAVASFGPARAGASSGGEESLARAARALEQGKPEIAIAELESLADRGVVDAHASFDRGLAYAERVRLGGGQTGDLGRAVQGFEEARRLTHESTLRHDAIDALQIVRTEIARQHARGQSVELESRTMSDSIASLLDVNGWGVLACVTSLLAGLAAVAAVRWRGRDDSVARRLFTSTLLVLAVTVPLSAASAAFARQRLGENRRTWAVVIAPETRVSSTAGRASTPLPEGAIVEITATDGARVEARWGAERDWITRRAVRMLVSR